MKTRWVLMIFALVLGSTVPALASSDNENQQGMLLVYAYLNG